MKKYVLCALLALPTRALAQPPAPATEVARPLRLSLGATSAFGVTGAGFFNQLVGARLDYRFTPRFALGAGLGYVNLEGKDRRVHNALPEAQLEYRVPIAGERFGLPLRFGLGFLPSNGPTLRAGAGLDFAFSERVSMDVVPLESMIWVSRERAEVSLNGSAALRLAF